ncbi:MAG: DUF3784 domain-containing protein [Clostridia bacterium]|nr:DUF3784 domain-containing protein [Clostridia bacterium]
MDTIVYIILFLLSAFAFVMSVVSFFEKGFLFNNAYIYSSKEERKKINKKPYYRQSSIVFLLIGIVFLLNALALVFDLDFLYIIVGILLGFTMIYAIVSSVLLGKKYK